MCWFNDTLSQTATKQANRLASHAPETVHLLPVPALVRSPTAVSIVCMSGAPARAARAAHQPAPSAAPHSPERGPTRSGIVTRARPSVGRDPPLIGPVWGTGRRGRAREGMCTSVSRGAWRTAVQRRALTVGSGPQRWQTGRAGDPPAKERCREREEDW